MCKTCENPSCAGSGVYIVKVTLELRAAQMKFTVQVTNAVNLHLKKTGMWSKYIPYILSYTLLSSQLTQSRNE